MRIRNGGELAGIGLALLASAALVAFCVIALQAPKFMILLAMPIAAVMLASGLLCLVRSPEAARRPASAKGILLPSVAWALGAIIACCAPWPILVALNPLLGPSSVPVALLASLCGTAGAILAGRWVDLSTDRPLVEHEEGTASI